MSTRKVLHIICQAHLDPVWLWRWREGCSEALTTMQSAVDRMTEFPDMRFSRSSAITYRWAQAMDPRLFAEIRRRLDEGRWEVVNGWIEQPDCNIPSTESFVRHCLYGKQYFARELGTDITIGYNVDSFGHSGGLPQLLARAGYGYYVFMRPMPHECSLPLLFWWESPDGARVLCWRIPHAYCQWGGAQPEAIAEMIRTAATENFAPGFDDGAFFLGVGNHGGGPTKAHLAVVRALQQDETLPELRFSTLREYFTALEATPALAELPVVRTELQHHARGCYAAMGEIKQLNRRAERSLGHAETLTALAGLDGELPYPTAALCEAWWKVLFNQFHDIMAGSSIAPAYAEARDSVGAACDTADQLTVTAVHALARRIDTTGTPEGLMVLANPLPWPRTAVVDAINFVSPNGNGPITHLRAADGEQIPLQWLPAGTFHADPQGWLRRLQATVALPAGGYRALHLAHGEAPAVAPWRSGSTTADDQFGLTGLAAPDGTALLAGPVGLVVVDDHSDTWGHDVTAYRQELGRPTLQESQVLDDGPVCRIVRQRATWGTSEILLYIITYRQLDAVEVRVRANWQERHQFLKLEVPTALAHARVFAKTAGSVTPRVANGEEEPCQDWVAVEGEVNGATYTVGLVNAGTYSYDCLDGLLRMAVLRAAPYAHHDPAPLLQDPDVPFQDQGWQERRYWLVCGPGAYTALNLHRLADELQTPAEYAFDSAHPGTAPWEQSLLSIGPAAVAVIAVKGAEDGDGLIIRLQEMHGQPATAEITLRGLPVPGIPLAPWELKTLRLRRTDAGVTVTETNLLES